MSFLATHFCSRCPCEGRSCLSRWCCSSDHALSARLHGGAQEKATTGKGRPTQGIHRKLTRHRHTHKHALTATYANVHAIQARTHALMYTRMYKHTHIHCTYTHTHTHTPMYTHRHAHTHSSVPRYLAHNKTNANLRQRQIVNLPRYSVARHRSGKRSVNHTSSL